MPELSVCPTCGSSVRAETSDEGTSYYVPICADTVTDSTDHDTYVCALPEGHGGEHEDREAGARWTSP